MSEQGITYPRARSAEDLLRIAEIYIEAFPAAERRPMRAIPSALRDPRCLFFRVDREGETIGLIHLWDLPACLFCEHLAVRADLRGQGVGQAAIAHAVSTSPKPLVVEVEPPLDEITRRRVRFYERLRFEPILREYTQPQYDATLPPVPLHLMARGQIECPPRQIAMQIHHHVYRC